MYFSLLPFSARIPLHKSHPRMCLLVHFPDRAVGQLHVDLRR